MLDIKEYIGCRATIPVPLVSWKRGEKKSRIAIKIQIPKDEKLSKKAATAIKNDFGVEFKYRPPWEKHYAYLTGFRNIIHFALKYGPYMKKEQHVRLIALLSQYIPSKISHKFYPKFQRNLFEEAEKVCKEMGKSLTNELNIKEYTISKYKNGRGIPLSTLFELISLLTHARITLINHSEIVDDRLVSPTYPSYKEILKNLIEIGTYHGTHSGGPYKKRQQKLKIGSDDLAKWVFNEPTLDSFVEKLEFKLRIRDIGGIWEGRWIVKNTSFTFEKLNRIEPFIRLILLIDPLLFDREILLRKTRYILKSPRPVEGHLESLYLKSYRKFQEKRFEFKSGLNLIVGSGGSGKTTILESIILSSINKKNLTRFELDPFIKDLIVGSGERIILSSFNGKYRKCIYSLYTPTSEYILQSLKANINFYDLASLINEKCEKKPHSLKLYQQIISEIETSPKRDILSMPYFEQFIAIYLPILIYNSTSIHISNLDINRPILYQLIDECDLFLLINRILEDKKKINRAKKILMKETIKERGKLDTYHIIHKLCRVLDDENTKIRTIPQFHETAIIFEGLLLHFMSFMALRALELLIPEFTYIDGDTSGIIETKLSPAPSSHTYSILNESEKKMLIICFRLIEAYLFTPRKLLLLDEIDMGIDDMSKARLFLFLKSLDFNQIIAATKDEKLKSFADNLIELE